MKCTKKELALESPEGLSDKERIFLAIIAGLDAARVLCPGGDCYQQETWRRRGTSEYYMHFAKYREPQPGDLVYANTGHASEWKIGWFVLPPLKPFGPAVIREIGSQRLCNYGNESFVPIVGLSTEELLEGEERRFYLKVLRAFGMGGEYCYRYGGIRFEGRKAWIAVREAFGGHCGPYEESIPFECEMKFTPKTRPAWILRTMRLAGYGTRKFEHRKRDVCA